MTLRPAFFPSLLAAAGCVPDAPAAVVTAPSLAAPGTAARDEGELLHVDFDREPLGTVAAPRLAVFGSVRWAQGLTEGRVRIVDTDRGRSLRVLYPKGSVGPREGGAQFFVPLPGAHDDLYCSYRVRFAEGFDFVRGGKLPGLTGGSHPTGGKPDDGGFSARLMWRAGGAAVQYVYYPRQSTTYGSDLPYLPSGAPARFSPGTWHRVEHRVAMNAPGQANGVLQAWIDGQLAIDARDRVWRLDGSVHVDALYFSTFFGGNDPSWGAARDETVDFDDFVVSTRPAGG
jgi:hypothetical protein